MPDKKDPVLEAFEELTSRRRRPRQVESITQEIQRRKPPPKAPKPRCSISGCEHEAIARGYCSAHYTRWRRHGDPTEVHYGKKEPK